MAYGPGESRFVEEKRHHEKPIPVSGLVLLDRERCILCDRCTRFAKDVAGDPLIHFQQRGSQTEVNTFPDEPFSSYFSGNTVQICPVGALTATSYRFRARPWDLEQVESTCQSCSVGCRVAVQSSRNEVLRYLGVDIDPVNWGWLCDKGRFDFEAVNSPERLSEPLVRAGDSFAPTRWTDALHRAATAIQAGLDTSGPTGLAVLGGARLTNEDAYAWAKLAKGVLGTDNVDAQLGDGLPAEALLGLPRATIDEVCRPGGTVVLLAADLKEELPVLFLRLRHAVVEDGVTVIEVGPQASGFSALSRLLLTPRPGEAVSVARALTGAAVGDVAGVTAAALAEARRLVDEADGPVSVVIGRQSLADDGSSVVAAAGVLLGGLPGVRFLPALRRSNVNGALDLGLAPGLLPGRVGLDAGRDWFTAHWGSVPAAPGLDARGILQAAADGRIDTLVLLGADPLADFPDRDLAVRALAGARTIIALDRFLTESSNQADIVLPVAGFAEVAGTTTNLEGRVSVLNQRVTPPGTARTDWVIAAELAAALGVDLGLATVEEIWREIEQVSSAHAGLTYEVLHAPASGDGVVIPLALPDAPVVDASDESEPEPESDTGAEGDAADDAPDAATAEGAPGPARPPLLVHSASAPVDVPPVDAYSLRLVVTRKLYDQGTLVSASPSLAGLAPGTTVRLNSYDFARLGVSTGDMVRVISTRATLTVAVSCDDAVPRGIASLYIKQSPVRPAELIDASERVTDVRIETGAG